MQNNWKNSDRILYAISYLLGIIYRVVYFMAYLAILFAIIGFLFQMENKMNLVEFIIAIVVLWISYDFIESSKKFRADLPRMSQKEWNKKVAEISELMKDSH